MQILWELLLLGLAALQLAVAARAFVAQARAISA